MTKQELYLKTMFCCMACDGDIAKEEIELVRTTAFETPIFEGIDIEAILNSYVSEINKDGISFLNRYLSELSKTTLSTNDELEIINLAIEMIEADNRIEYSEVKFFKKIRSRLSLPDELILKQHPDKEDFLLSDINVAEDPMWNDITFENINFI